jgi:glycosyltransferase involved in cell wall biosynthesis
VAAEVQGPATGARELRATATAGMEAPTPAGNTPDVSNPVHPGLQPLAEAVRLTQAKVVVLPVPMLWEPSPWLRGRAELIAKALKFLGAHVRLVGQLWRHRQADLILVREFLTAMVMVVWPLIWPLRRRVYFLVNHNLQEAHRRAFERTLVRLLARSGFRFACLETTAGFAELGIAPDGERFLVLPHPLAGLAPPEPARNAADEPVVGVIGAMRAEKGSEEILAVLAQLRAEGRLAARLLLGCPEAEVRAAWRARGFEVVDTSSDDAYRAALARCEVVVLNYRRDRYLYRASGVAADALAHRAAVVCPDFPLMRHQLSVPAQVGAVFDGIGGLEAAVLEALALRPDLGAALARQEQARNAVAIAARLDAFVAGLRRAEVIS